MPKVKFVANEANLVSGSLRVRSGHFLVFLEYPVSICVEGWEREEVTAMRGANALETGRRAVSGEALLLIANV